MKSTVIDIGDEGQQYMASRHSLVTTTQGGGENIDETSE